jgi:D-alanyl-D-alanine carboxypeptidase
MVKNILHKEVRLYLVVILLLIVSISAIIIIVTFKDTIYNYQISLPANNQNNHVESFTYGSWPALENADFYNSVENSMIAQKTTFISVNLSTMRLQYYTEGVLTDDVAVLAKGKPGSWWETPAGLYKVEEKIRTDFSNFAHVYSPWALDFQGNFLIHGWPYYPDGTPVGSTYSGGCIRLSTEDAKALYTMVSVGTPVLVSSANFDPDTFQEQFQEPPILATSYFAADLKSDFVFAEKDPDTQVPIASLTKLMTALVAVEYINIENTITIKPSMIVKTSIPRLKVGEKLSLYNLLQPLLKESSNEAAMAISDFLGTKHFVDLMNQTAQSIGMTDTHFTDPSGSDWADVSTAHDLFVLAQYLYDNRSFILKMTTNNKDPNVYGPSVFTNLQNFNVFADDPDFVGGKVGQNGAASGTILSIFNEDFSGNSENIGSSTDERPIMFVILGSDNYTQASQDFLTWIKSTYR